MKCRRLTPADQVKAVERKLRRKLTAQERFDVVDAAQDFICTPGALGRVRGPRHRSRGRR